MKYVFTILALCGLAFSQSAPVVQLSEFDAGHARQVYQEKLRADKAWDDLKSQIYHDYLRSESGFSSEFDFSKDFKSVVPHYTYPSNSYSYTWPCGTGGMYLTTPTTGTGLTFSNPNSITITH